MPGRIMKVHLRTITFEAPAGAARSLYPFSVPVIQALSSLELTTPVTVLAGENGCGKSTLLEAIAAAAGSLVVGGEAIDRDETLSSARLLAKHLRLSWTRRTHKGLFLRSEDFFNFAHKIRKERAELQGYADEFKTKFTGYGRMLAVDSALGQKRALESKYGEDLDANSHGESFLKLFKGRFQSDGFYILDEPEAPLSPLRQIALISMIQDCVNRGSQFLIATHSPILMAYPGAKILLLDGESILPSAYEDLEHVKITKLFLNNPASFLKRL